MLGRIRSYDVALAKAVFAAVVVVGLVTIAWCWSQTFEGCAVQPLSEGFKLALSQYSDTVKQVLTLSTALAALGAALLLGLREGPRLTDARRVLILASTTCFVFSAYFSLLWQSSLAEPLLLECPSLITHPVTRFPFIAATNSFLVGLALMGIIVLAAAFDGATQKENGDEEHGR